MRNIPFARIVSSSKDLISAKAGGTEKLFYLKSATLEEGVTGLLYYGIDEAEGGISDCFLIIFVIFATRI